MFWLGICVGSTVLLAISTYSMWRRNQGLNERLREQQGWLARLDEEFDRLSLGLFNMRVAMKNDNEPPSEEQMKEAEEALLEILNELMSGTSGRVMA